MSKKITCGSAGSGTIYALGVLGAIIYYLQNTAGVAAVLLGIIKAFFWPAFFVFELYKHFAI